MNPESAAMVSTALSGIIVLLVVGTLYTLISPMLEGDKLKKRMSSVSSARDGMREARLKALNNNTGLRRDTKDGIKNLVDNLSLERLMEASDLKRHGFGGEADGDWDF